MNQAEKAELLEQLEQWNKLSLIHILETGYMDVIRDSIENRADDVCRAKEELRTTPVYSHSAAYAREHGELEQYRASNNANLQCKESIEAAVREHFDGMYLSHDAANGVIEIYGMERVSMVLSLSLIHISRFPFRSMASGRPSPMPKLPRKPPMRNTRQTCAAMHRTSVLPMSIWVKGVRKPSSRPISRQLSC